jgi:hypothetical protein
LLMDQSGVEAPQAKDADSSLEEWLQHAARQKEKSQFSEAPFDAAREGETFLLEQSSFSIYSALRKLLCSPDLKRAKLDADGDAEMADEGEAGSKAN